MQLADFENSVCAVPGSETVGYLTVVMRPEVLVTGFEKRKERKSKSQATRHGTIWHDTDGTREKKNRHRGPRTTNSLYG